jgi:hypothetical protein
MGISPMSMAAVYMAIPMPGKYSDLNRLARRTAAVTADHATRKRQCHVMSRRALEQLVVQLAPSPYQELASHVLANDAWSFVTPGADSAATRGLLAARGLAIPKPLWPHTPGFACVVGSPPARVVAHRAALVPAEIVGAAMAELADCGDEGLAGLLAAARDAGHAVLLEWQPR